MEEQQRTTTVTESNHAVDGGTIQREHVAETTTVSGAVVARRVVWFIAGIIITLLVLRIVLQLLGANQGNPFVDLVYGLSYPFAWPFFGIFNYTPSYGVVYFELSSLVAIAVYALLAWGIARLLTLNRPAPEI